MGLTYRPFFLADPAFSTPEVRGAYEAGQQEWGRLHTTPSPLDLHHYTTLDGLEGILKSRSLYFSHASTMNDPQELRWGKQIVDECLREVEIEEEEFGLQAFMQSLRTQVGTVGLFQHVYVVSFCQKPNLLSLWRGYTERGGGYSLHFSVTDCTRLAPVATPGTKVNAFFRRVIYKPERQRKIVKQYVDRAVAAARDAISKGDGPEPATYWGAVMGIEASHPLIEMVLCFKHGAFREEEEWRAIRVVRDNEHPEQILFRRRGEEFLPCRPTLLFDERTDSAARHGIKPGDMGAFPLVGIRCGPSHPADRVVPAVQLLVSAAAVMDHPVRIVPYMVNVQHAGFELR